MPPTAGMDEDLHRPVEGVPVGQRDNDALGRSCRRGGVGSNLVGGTLYPWVAQKGGRGSAVLGEIGAPWGNTETQVRDEGPPTCCNHGQASSIPPLAKRGLRWMVSMAFPAPTSGPTGVKVLLPLGAHKEKAQRSITGHPVNAFCLGPSCCSGRALIDKKLCPYIPLNP